MLGHPRARSSEITGRCEPRSRELTSPGVRRTVNIGLLDDDASGGAGARRLGPDRRVGFALSKVDEEEALATRKMLEAMGADYEQELEELKASVIE